ncbi:MAG: sugar phosphate isomerase/epimerase [Microbacteriaceae bacterium]|jgi:sugar phosphate isomerase/epimerase|nr:sugar phosphate isomerase/epimerase [Microbacteriaceae bacterium]HOB57782.1 sugar phosphate isomerase/epimerase [Rhodoglobus sp.]HPU04351.1 sugar phosphate isomerase/epimerase [Rhodoglobus sp.]
MKLGYNTWSMPTLSFEEAARYCAGLGYDSLEVTVSEGWSTDVMLIDKDAPAQWRAIADDAGIYISSLTANVPVIVDGADWVAARDRLQRSFELAAALQLPGQRMPVSLGAFAPIEVDGGTRHVIAQPPWERHRSKIIDRFGELATIAAATDTRVALESHVAAIVSRPEYALDVLEQVNSEYIGLNLDISHFAVQGDSIPEVVRLLGPHAIVSEVKDQLGVEPDFDFLIPGEGNFDYTEFAREMNAVGYEGSIAVEISVFRQRRDGYDPYAAAAASYEVLAPAFEAAGIVRPARAAKIGE